MSKIYLTFHTRACWRRAAWLRRFWWIFSYTPTKKHDCEICKKSLQCEEYAKRHHTWHDGGSGGVVTLPRLWLAGARGQMSRWPTGAQQVLTLANLRHVSPPLAWIWLMSQSRLPNIYKLFPLISPDTDTGLSSPLIGSKSADSECYPSRMMTLKILRHGHPRQTHWRPLRTKAEAAAEHIYFWRYFG